jgi:hypothetical protein
VDSRPPKSGIQGCQRFGSLRLSDGTMPVPTGSPTASMTRGTEVVAFLTARVAGVPAVTITATFRASSSPMRAGKRSYFPSAHRYSIRTFRPSTYPRSRNPSRNGPTRLASRAAVEFPYAVHVARRLGLGVE